MNRHSVCFATDHNYIQHLFVAIISLIYNNSSLKFNIYIINDGLENSIWKKLRFMTDTYDVKIIDVCISNELFDKLVTRYHFTKAMYYRLLIPELIKKDKVLYLDTDIVINGNLLQLLNLKLSNDYIAAVINPGFNRHSELGMDTKAKYFNSGVMLINNMMWRKYNIAANIVEFIDSNRHILQFPDQDGINRVINGKWTPLPMKYNQQTIFLNNSFLDEERKIFCLKDINEAKYNPIIIHYTGSSKPWHYRDKHPYKHLYWQYLKMTPFKNYIPEDLTFSNILKSMLPVSLKEKIKSMLH